MRNINTKRREIFPSTKQWEAMIEQIAGLTRAIEGLAEREISEPKWRAMMAAFEEVRKQNPKGKVN